MGSCYPAAVLAPDVFRVCHNACGSTACSLSCKPLAYTWQQCFVHTSVAANGLSGPRMLPALDRHSTGWGHATGLYKLLSCLFDVVYVYVVGHNCCRVHNGARHTALPSEASLQIVIAGLSLSICWLRAWLTFPQVELFLVTWPKGARKSEP